MKFIKDYLWMREIKKDFTIDGLVEKYDDASPVMFGEIIEAKDSIIDMLMTYGNIEDLVIMIKRVAKIPILGGYLVDLNDVIAVYTKEEFNKL